MKTENLQNDTSIKIVEPGGKILENANQLIAAQKLADAIVLTSAKGGVVIVHKIDGKNEVILLPADSPQN